MIVITAVKVQAGGGTLDVLHGQGSEEADIVEEGGTEDLEPKWFRYHELGAEMPCQLCHMTAMAGDRRADEAEEGDGKGRIRLAERGEAGSALSHCSFFFVR
jgi:hypothetical protein